MMSRRQIWVYFRWAAVAVLLVGSTTAPTAAAGLGQDPVWSSTDLDSTTSLAWDDFDRDGDPDLAVGNGGEGEPVRIYRNDAGVLVLVWSAPGWFGTQSVDWGDVDGDSDLELITGNFFEVGVPNVILDVQGESLAISGFTIERELTAGVAWADWNGDGKVDHLAVANLSGPDRLYEVVDGKLEPAWMSQLPESSSDLAWSDWDDDGDLDLAVATRDASSPLRIYRNDAGILVAAWSSTEKEATAAIAWGDWDGDGDDDLAVANFAGPNRVYRNDDGQLQPVWASTEREASADVAWGDWDGDRDLDLAFANGAGEPSRVYEWNGSTFAPVWMSAATDAATSVAWADLEGDGDLDLAIGNYALPNRVYLNDRAVKTWELEVTVAGDGGGSVVSTPAGIDCDASCSASFGDGQNVALEPTETAGAKFDSWSGDDDCADGMVTMTADHSCVASFPLLTPVEVADDFLGNADSPGKPDCNEDAVVDVRDVVCVINRALGG